MREDPRITRTRNLIRDALDSLREQKSFSDISVQDIAERATINRATFYAHFEDKYALLEDVVRHRYRFALARHDSLSAKDMTTLLETVALDTFELIGSRRKKSVDKAYEPRLEHALQDELYNFLLPALGESAALVVSSAIIGAMLQWRACPYKSAVEGLVNRLATVLSTGVCLESAQTDTAISGKWQRWAEGKPLAPRSVRTKNLIRETLLALLEEKPFSGIGVQDVAEHARISRATFYAHFEDKYVLLDDVMRLQYRERLDALDSASMTAVAEFINVTSSATFEHVSCESCKVDREFHPWLERVMQDELYKFVLPALGEPAALVVSSAVIRAVMQWRSSGRKEPVNEMVRRLVTVLSRGVDVEGKALMTTCGSSMQSIALHSSLKRHNSDVVG